MGSGSSVPATEDPKAKVADAIKTLIEHAKPGALAELTKDLSKDDADEVSGIMEVLTEKVKTVANTKRYGPSMKAWRQRMSREDGDLHLLLRNIQTGEQSRTSLLSAMEKCIEAADAVKMPGIAKLKALTPRTMFYLFAVDSSVIKSASNPIPISTKFARGGRAAAATICLAFAMLGTATWNPNDASWLNVYGETLKLNLKTMMEGLKDEAGSDEDKEEDKRLIAELFELPNPVGWAIPYMLRVCAAGGLFFANMGAPGVGQQFERRLASSLGLPIVELEIQGYGRQGYKPKDILDVFGPTIGELYKEWDWFKKQKETDELKLFLTVDRAQLDAGKGPLIEFREFSLEKGAQPNLMSMPFADMQDPNIVIKVANGTQAHIMKYVAVPAEKVAYLITIDKKLCEAPTGTRVPNTIYLLWVSGGELKFHNTLHLHELVGCKDREAGPTSWTDFGAVMNTWKEQGTNEEFEFLKQYADLWNDM